MTTERVIYPVSDVTLCGFLGDVNTILCAVSDSFTYKERANLDGVFLLLARSLISTAIKEIETTGTITLVANEARAFVEKASGPMNADMVLAALLSTAIRRTATLRQRLVLTSDAKAELAKSVGEAVSTLRLSGHISPDMIHQVISEIEGAIRLLGELGQVKREVDIDTCAYRIRLLNRLSMALEKTAAPSPLSYRITATLNAIERRYRTLGDLADTTLGDLSTWTLRKFYYIEE